MHKMAFSFLSLFMLACLASFAGAADRGDIATIPEHTWVTVMNPDGIDNGGGNGRFDFGEICSVKPGSTITMKARSGNNQLLVEYASTKRAFGAQCPTGTLFFVGGQDFTGMTAKHNRLAADLEAERRRVRELITPAEE